MSDQIRKMIEKLDNSKKISNGELFEYCMELFDLDFYNGSHYIKNRLKNIQRL